MILKEYLKLIIGGNFLLHEPSARHHWPLRLHQYLSTVTHSDSVHAQGVARCRRGTNCCESSGQGDTKRSSHGRANK